MAANCNIPSLAIGKANAMFYGLSCEDSDPAVIESYIRYLNCPFLPSKTCYPDTPCNNSPIYFNCLFNIIKVEISISDDESDDDSTITYSVSSSDFAGGTPPFIYQWSFDTSVFTASSAINQDTTILTLKPQKALTNLVSKIQLTVTDSNGCMGTKVCWLNKGDLRCNDNFVPCVNPSNLSVFNAITNCSPASNLVVINN